MFHYTTSIPYASVPDLQPDGLRREVRELVGSGWRVLAFLGVPKGAAISLLCILGNPKTGMLDAFRTDTLGSFHSLTPKCPQVHLFEREIYEEFGVKPEGHPWLKPVRYASEAAGKRPGPAETDYYRVTGREIHEVAVGPVHAGVIEPGHFRFQCYGENVLHLEIQLGFQHRDVERLLRTTPMRHQMPLIENTAGDTAIGHGTAYCTLVERLAGVRVSRRAKVLRRLALELERLANHTRDLGAIGGDTGFLPTSSWNGRITGDFLNLTAEICGSRFGRGLLCPGGALWDVDDSLAHELFPRLRAAYRDARGSVDVMLQTQSVLSRLRGTGVVTRQAAEDLGLVGVAARACGVAMDARADWPLEGHSSRAIQTRTEESGDVYARTLVRSHELDDSAASAEGDLHRLADGLEGDPIRVDMPDRLPADRLAVSLVEGWRGEICHVGLTDGQGGWRVYKIIDPSFHNWMGLAMALRDEQISDFPLCNKSFNLSYCGHDL